jgi:Restriction endonuclease
VTNRAGSKLVSGGGSPGGATLDDPILNGPYDEPARHWAFDDHGITSEIVTQRRPSAYFVPIPAARGSAVDSGQTELDMGWTQDRLRENDLVNEVRRLVTKWRFTGRRGLTTTSHRLLEHWTREGRDRRLFYAQLEAAETTMWLLEVAPKDAPHIVNRLKAENEMFSSGLTRVAAKLATGAGKTMVMALLICWHACNKHTNDKDRRFSDCFLVVAPGITIRDRLRVLLPNDPDNYYRAMDLVPADLRAGLEHAKVVITNFHGFALKETREAAGAGKLTKQILTNGGANPFVETPDQMVRRVCREFGARKRGIVVINDEAHHCWQRPPHDRPAGAAEERLSRDEEREAAAEAKDAHLWLGGLRAIDRKIGIRAVHDLSATPFFLKGSGYGEGTLFPWVITDFSLIDAIEAGLVKIPRLPVDDNAGGEQVVYRELWSKIGKQLPKQSRATAATSDIALPDALAQALQSLYDNYVKCYQRWEQAGEAGGPTPPVFIVVCQNTAISKMVYDYIAGWPKQLAEHDQPVVQAGELDLFRNDDGRGGWLGRPRTILVDSKQIESGEAMTPEFKRLAGREIDEFKQELRQRFPGRNVDDLTDEDLLREVLNTVGKDGRLGEHVRCVVSVSMLTEGWDVNTVSHVLGVRAFGTQLLCEQVVGRGLRRRSYAVDEATGKFTPEYAEVYGVPFSFIRTTGKTVDKPTRPVVRVQALEDRKYLTIAFPNVTGYRYEITDPRLAWHFDDTSTLRLDTRDLPTQAQVSGVVGESEIHTLDEWRAVREQTVAYKIAEKVLAKLRTPDGADRPWLFPQVVAIVKIWLRQHLELHDETFPGLLLAAARRDEAAERVYRAIARTPGAEQARRLLPTLRQGEPASSTDVVDFDTIRPVYKTDPHLSHISHVALHSSWEQAAATAIESTPRVTSYCKNDHLGFHIPYVYEGEPHYYEPDFLISLDVGDGLPPATLIVEISGDKEPAKKAAKCSTARDLWCTSVNNDRRYGRWYFAEITDVIHIRKTLRKAVDSALAAHTATSAAPAYQEDD